MAIDLSALYGDYIACLNSRALARLGTFVDDNVQYNGEEIGLVGYRKMLARNFDDIPDLRFDVRLLVANLDVVASRLEFDCTPRGELLGLPVNGRRVRFAENVFYRYCDGRIASVWSVIDKAAIEAQL